LTILPNEEVAFSVQGTDWTFSILCKVLIKASGGHLSPAYFELLNMEITECLYHLLNYIQYCKELQPSKIEEWGLNDVEFE